MRRFKRPTPHLDQLRKRYAPYLDEKGQAQRVADAVRMSKQQFSLWLKKGVGRQTAAKTLILLRYLIEELEPWNDDLLFIPSWEELVEIVLPLRRVRGTTSELAQVCAVPMDSISRYFARTPSKRKEPDGEVALCVLNWLVSKRMRWSLSKTEEAPPIEPERTALQYEAAFAAEYRFREERGEKIGKRCVAMFDPI